MAQHKPIFAPNNTLIETPGSVQRRTQVLFSINSMLGGNYVSETASTQYAQPVAGSSPNGLGFNFGDSWRRTQRGVMEFNLPVGQSDVINMAFRYACENVFVGKALRVKTNFTCKGVTNAGPDEEANGFFNSVHKELYLQDIYRKAVWLYYMAGLVPIIISEPGKALEYLEIVDPRMVRVERAFGKIKMWLIPDKRMMNAASDPKGDSDPRNKFYWDSMPSDWKAQLKKLQDHVGGPKERLIELKDDTYIVLENRDNAFNRTPGSYDGIALQPYFAACEQYRMLMSGDFAAAFLAKNLLALVSIGDPQTEKDMYIRPDNGVLQMLQASVQNPNQAQWMFVDPTFNVRYITPDKDVFASEKYAEVKESLKNLLPSPFWYNSGQGSFAGATVEMNNMQEEISACNDDFDRNFWMPIHERAAAEQGRGRIAKKNIRPPRHDKNALKDDQTWLTANANLYNNGGLSVRSLLESHGYDPDVELARKEQEQSEIKKKIWMPAFEQKQNIVAATQYGLKPPAAGGASGSGGKGGRPNKPGGRPQSERSAPRTPRPSEKK